MIREVTCFSVTPADSPLQEKEVDYKQFNDSSCTETQQNQTTEPDPHVTGARSIFNLGRGFTLLVLDLCRLTAPTAESSSQAARS